MTALRRGWFHLASGAGIGRIFGFLSNLLLSRWLGPIDLGLFNLVTTTVQTSDTLARCGGDYALNYELGGKPDACQTEHSFELAHGLAQICSLMTILTCVCVATWVWFAQGLFPISLGDTQRLILTALLLLMIFCEGSSAAAWEVLLVSHRTGLLSLRQGLFFPLRLFFAAIAALFGGVSGAMLGWTLVAIVQCVWLRRVLGNLWRPLRVWPLWGSAIRRLLIRGLPFYGSNLLASIIFYPLLIQVATASGLAEVGYLRVGQILQQIFAFLPATLVPILFLRLRSESSFADQVALVEKPLRIIWFVLLEVLLLYCMIDHVLISWLFGVGFDAALLSTRLLLITALFECLSQIVVQPLLAAGQTRLYGFWQNGSAALAAAIGWFWIPQAGLAAYLIVRMLYVIIPLIGFGIPVLQNFRQPRKISLLLLFSVGLLVLVSVQIFLSQFNSSMTAALVVPSLVLVVWQRDDLVFFKEALSRRP